MSLNEALLAVAVVMDDLHRTNLRLQDRIGANLARKAGLSDLVEDLQVLDRQAQVTRDLADSLRTLAKSAKTAVDSSTVEPAILFRLDATREALLREPWDGQGTDAEHSDDVFF